MRATLRIAVALILFAVVSSPAPAAQKLDLQFRPAPSDAQTLKVTSVLIMSYAAGPQQQEVANTRTITLAFEPGETTRDGAVQVRLRFVAIQEKSGMPGAPAPKEYDSTKAQDSDDPLGGYYSAFIGASLPAEVSARGEIVEMATDELFLAVAENTMKREDEMMRQRLGQRAEQAIERTNQRFGSREGRKQALRKQVEAFPLLNRDRLQALVGSLILRFPDEPVQVGESWDKPIAVDGATSFEMQGTYTLKLTESGRCAIALSGQRSMQDDPIISQTGPTQTSMRLAGTYKAMIDIDPKTGLLLGKQAQMKFTGETQMANQSSQGQPASMQITMEGTNTTVVEVVTPAAPSSGTR
ncbi:MAG: hypothetical protein JW993_09435 [Sedimentisphaerales bacterium]|nr:hypothetical protein [Sedimentisphaerales bacterium]